MDMKQITNRIDFFDIEKFNETPGPFCMSFGFDIQKIICSIEKVGLINIPYIKINENGYFDIVTGYRRIMALKTLKWESVPCIELTNSGLSDSDLLIFNLSDNLCTRRFNNIEKGMIINNLLLFFSIDEIYMHYMELLNITSSREIDILLKINRLSNTEKNIILTEAIPNKTIEYLLDLKESSRRMVLKWISDLKLNINQQIIFIEYINDISIKEEKDIPELLNEEIYLELIMEKKQSIPQKAKKFIDFLKARRLPILTKNEKAFHRQIAKLSLPKNVKIKHPPYFEGPDYLLEINFTDGMNLKKTISALEQIKGLATISDPWKEK